MILRDSRNPDEGMFLAMKGGNNNESHNHNDIGSFIVYICIEGTASVQVPSFKDNGEACMDNYELAKGETILIPADMPDFYLVPRDRSTVLLEAVTRVQEVMDAYIDPDTEAFLEGEDYEGLEDGIYDDDEEDEEIGPSGASPLGFFGAGRNPLS